MRGRYLGLSDFGDEAVELCAIAGHPLRKVRQIVHDAPLSLDAEFAALYPDFARPSIAPERLIQASLLQILFAIRSAAAAYGADGLPLAARVVRPA